MLLVYFCVSIWVVKCRTLRKCVVYFVTYCRLVYWLFCGPSLDTGLRGFIVMSGSVLARLGWFSGVRWLFWVLVVVLWVVRLWCLVTLGFL